MCACACVCTLSCVQNVMERQKLGNGERDGGWEKEYLKETDRHALQKKGRREDEVNVEMGGGKNSAESAENTQFL